jgi:hypothetical protein
MPFLGGNAGSFPLWSHIDCYSGILCKGYMECKLTVFDQLRLWRLFYLFFAWYFAFQKVDILDKLEEVKNSPLFSRVLKWMSKGIFCWRRVVVLFEPNFSKRNVCSRPADEMVLCSSLAIDFSFFLVVSQNRSSVNGETFEKNKNPK